MPSRMRTPVLAALAAVACAAVACARGGSGLSAPRVVAPGVEFYQLADPALVEGAGPIAVHLLKLDPARVRVEAVLANQGTMGVEPVDRIAQQRSAVAAINGGYFNRANGDPMGLLKVAGELVSDSTLARGVVILDSPPVGRSTLRFDILAAKLTAHFRAGGRDWETPVDGVDTTRERGHVMLYTPSYHGDTDTAPTGTEWVLDGTPLQVTEVRPNAGKTPIPRHGAVLSFGGLTLTEPLAALGVGVPVRFETHWRSAFGTPPDLLEGADAIVSGAGLLRRDGVVREDWRAEGLNSDTFPAARHPRTFIGDDARGFIWLGAVDGRQPDYSIGMTFADLERLCDRIGLRDALNLDGGGSTTMVVDGEIVNRPSDAAGPRPVSDAILVTLRQGSP